MDLTADLVMPEPTAKPIPVPEPTPGESALKNRIDDLCEQAERAVVHNQDTYEKAADLGKWLRAAKAKGEEERKKITDPLNQVIKLIMDRFRGPTEKLETARRVLDKKMIDYSTKIEAERKKAAEEARLKEAAERAKMEGDEAVVVEPPPRVSVSAAPVARGNFGSVASVRSKWTWKLVDISKVPPEHLLPNGKTLQAAVTAGARQIPGIEIFEEKGIAIR
jgi:hypothetical protein